MPQKWLWIEQYRNCGCCSEANRKKDLLGYCAIHGTDVMVRYKIPVGSPDWLKKLDVPNHGEDEND